MREQAPLYSSELVVLLNRLAAKRKPLVLRVPVLDAEIMRYDPRSATITSAISKAEYNAKRRRLTDGDFLAGEVPTWSDIEHAMRAAGLAPFGNEDEIKGVVRSFEEEGLDRSRPKLAFLGLDTNVLYHRLATRHVDRILGHAPQAIRFALSKGTRDELDAQAKAKYSPDEVDLMAAAWGQENLVRSFLNLKGRRNRRAHNGLGEYEALVRRRRAAEAPCEETSTDKEENDRRIAKSYAAFEKAHRAVVQFITADGGMITHTDAQELRSLHLQYGHQDSIPKGPVEESALLHFIHDLAVECLVVEFGGTSIQMWSDWSKKRPSQWNDQVMLFTYAADDDLAKDVRAELRICDLVKEAEREGQAMVEIYQAPKKPVAKETQQAVVEKSDEMGLSSVMEIATLRREMTQEQLCDELGVQLPEGILQMDDCIKDALLAGYLRKRGQDDQADILAEMVRRHVLATKGKEFLLGVAA